MLLEYTHKGSRVVIRFLHDVMMNNSKVFIREYEEILREVKGDTIIFNFKKIQFMDSSGIGALINAASLAKKNHYEVIVIGLNSTLFSVFRLSGLHTIMKIYSVKEFQEKHPDLLEL
jgi:stage II sporulation protein AA (anti-sigma F factor antagonist)